MSTIMLHCTKAESNTPEERLANWTAKEVNDKRAGHEMFAVG